MPMHNSYVYVCLQSYCPSERPNSSYIQCVARLLVNRGGIVLVTRGGLLLVTRGGLVLLVTKGGMLLVTRGGLVLLVTRGGLVLLMTRGGLVLLVTRGGLLLTSIPVLLNHHQTDLPHLVLVLILCGDVTPSTTPTANLQFTSCLPVPQLNCQSLSATALILYPNFIFLAQLSYQSALNYIL